MDMFRAVRLAFFVLSFVSALLYAAIAFMPMYAPKQSELLMDYFVGSYLPPIATFGAAPKKTSFKSVRVESEPPDPKTKKGSYNAMVKSLQSSMAMQTMPSYGTSRHEKRFGTPKANRKVVRVGE